MEKIVFFEEINGAYNALINNYLKNDFVVYFFNISGNYAKKQKTKNHIESAKLVNISSVPFEYALYKQASFYAHENIDSVFDAYFSNNDSIRNMGKLLQFPEMANMYKKELAMKLEKIYEMELKINEIVTHDTDLESVHFVPCNAFEMHVDVTSLLANNVKVICHNNFRLNLNHILNKSIKISLLAYPVYLFVRKVKWITLRKKREEFNIGITINHPKNMFVMNNCNEDFFIAEEELPKENVLFIDECGELNVNDYKKRGYNHVRLLNDRDTISWDLFWKIIKCFSPIWLKSIFSSFSEDSLIVETNRKILSDYIKWNLFADTYKINNYVRRVVPDNISKIHVLSHYQIKTWLTYPDNSSTDYYLDWDGIKKNQIHFSFLYYDNIIIQGETTERFFKKHRNNVTNYFKTGVLFSQTINELKKNKLNSMVPSLIKKNNLPPKIISIFDTSYSDQNPLKIRDGINFGNDIIKLMYDFPDVGFIFKAKKEFETTPYLSSIYNKLKDHDRCLFFSRFDGTGVSSAEAIAVSDLVISAAFTSTTAEALGAKIKAIYYDPAGYYVGDGYLLNKYPNFVAHSYEELKKLINYWLYEVTDDEFENFLNTYVKDEIDPYLDGKAISRLRQLLLQ